MKILSEQKLEVCWKNQKFINCQTSLELDISKYLDIHFLQFYNFTCSINFCRARILPSCDQTETLLRCNKWLDLNSVPITSSASSFSKSFLIWIDPNQHFYLVDIYCFILIFLYELAISVNQSVPHRCSKHQIVLSYLSLKGSFEFLWTSIPISSILTRRWR